MADPTNPSGAEAPTNTASGATSGGATTGGASAAPSDPRAGGPGNLPSAPAGALAGTAPAAQEQAAAQAEEGGPFEGEARVMSEGVAMRDDISKTQAAPTNTRDVSSSHIARLLYRPIDTPGGPVYQSQELERRNRR